MNWHWSMIGLLAMLGVLISAPLWVALIWGRTAACGTAGTAQCLRDWISSLSGPLAIIAAIIAAWPVWEQLEENRAATRLAMASVIRLEEQTIEGQMAALRQEDILVEGSIKVPQRVIRLISLIESGGVKNDIVEEEFRQLRDDADVDIAEARSIAQEMDSKSDKDTVIPSRKAVEAEYNRFITTFEEVKKYGNVRDAGSAFKGQLSSLRDTCVAIEASLGNYNAEFLALNQKKAQERDELERKRLETTENAGFYKK